MKEACAAAAAHCKSEGLDLAPLALKWALRGPGPATTLVGMASVEVVRSNVAAALQVGVGGWGGLPLGVSGRAV